MNILSTLTRRSLKLNRKRTIVTIIGIILSAAMICATITIAVSFQDLLCRAQSSPMETSMPPSTMSP